MNWHDNLITEHQDIMEIAGHSKRIAVLGIRSKNRSHRAAHYVPQYLASAGVEIIPVPVYEPEMTEILGKPVFRKLEDIPGKIDLVNVFRRPEDIPAHIPDILAKKPAAVWFQLGIQNDRAAEELARAGIKVVQNRCLMVDHRLAKALDPK
jgi:uncharacterized protein